MPAFLVGGQKPKALYVAGVKAKKVMAGTGTSAVQVWSAMNPQGMVLSADNGSNWGDWYGKWGVAHPMAADPAYPGSIATNNALVVAGSGTGSVEIGVGFNNEFGTDSTRCRALLNGVVIGTFISTDADRRIVSGSIPGIAVVEGDQLVLEAYQKYGANTLRAAYTYLRFVPN